MRKFWLLVLMASSVLSFAQNDRSNKLSMSTQLFMDEMAGKFSLTNNDLPTRRKAPARPGQSTTPTKHRGKNHGRFIAAPDTIAGKVYISAFIRLDDNTDISDLEALGVEVQCKFQNGLVTANIPVDKINDVAGISKVKHINVARLKRPLTDKVREASNVDDALTLSTDAITAGLQSQYDGTGVVLGVIDTGIDFQHIAFKDADGNSRIKRAYVYNGSSAKEYTSISSSSPTTDDSSEDHGTHTSSTAGGSSVVVSGSSVTVTNDHSKATYGGMAPGSDLYLAGINGLSDTYIANAFQKICDYADSQNKPVVVSNSWGASIGPRDGTGDIADICAQYFSDDNPNHICLFAASNDAGTDGFHVSGTATSSSPMGTVVKWNSDYVDYYYGIIADAWARNANCTLGCKLIVISKSTGKVATTISVSPSSSGTTVSGLSSYFSGSLYAYKDYLETNKSEILLYTEGLQSSSYYLAVQFYPTSGSTVVDVWNGGYCLFSSTPSSSGYTWIEGSDDMSVSDEATIPDAISIGAYVTKNSVTDYNGSSHSMTSYFPTVGDIAYFSSYATADQSPTGLQYPWICAPGATTVAAVNHYDTSGDLSYINGNSAKYGMYRVNANTTYPYGTMEGTSMATPAAAGIVALWLQAAQEVDKELSTSEVKEIMKETAINDAYTTGSNATHFGNGKLDALAGIKYILGASSSPTIKATPSTVELTGYATQQQTITISVKGFNLEDDIDVSISGSNEFSVDKTSITQTDGSVAAELIVTWAPLTAGEQTATVTLSSSNAESVTITLSGTAEAATPTIVVDKQQLTFSAMPGNSSEQTIKVSGRFLNGNVSVALTDSNGAFAVAQSSLAADDVCGDGLSLAVSFNPEEEGTYQAILTLSAEGAEDVVVNLSGTARLGGTASDAFLDIAQYATIDDAGWSSSYVNNLYKYTEYADDEVAWLTLPVYGAYASVAFSPKAQKWISYSGTGYSGRTWSSSDIYQGSSSYFTSATSRSFGSTNGYTEHNVAFYVTNIIAAKLLGKNTKNVSSRYPTSLKVYECTMNSDGSLTAESEASQTVQNTTQRADVDLTISDLDESKIYKVVVSNYQGYLYEVGFQTSLAVDKTPILTVDPSTITFDNIYATQESTQTFTIAGQNLTDDVTISIVDENDVYSVDVETLTADAAMAGATVTATFNPQTSGTFTATLTISSADAEPVSVTLTGTAVAATPTIIADSGNLDFTANLDTQTSKVVNVSGRFLSSDVTATITDANGVFSVSPATLSVDEVNEGQTALTVTFVSSVEGTYDATLTLASEGAESVVINLSATANDGGTAANPYLDIAKYATIDEVGWTTSRVDNLYQYTVDEAEEFAWLTLPIYGAWVTTYYDSNSQKWIESNVTDNNNKYAGTPWSASENLLGSSSYFTNTNSRAMGFNSGTNYTEETVTFYVTNTTAVQLLGTGQSKATESYPASLAIYECTADGNGTLTAATSATYSSSNYATTGTFVLAATDLDASKIYKVVASTYRSYICEIGFQTPLEKSVIGDVNRDGSVTIADVTAIVNIILGKATEGDDNNYDFEAADVNADGSITIADVTALVNSILAKE